MDCSLTHVYVDVNEYIYIYDLYIYIYDIWHLYVNDNIYIYTLYTCMYIHIYNIDYEYKVGLGLESGHYQLREWNVHPSAHRQMGTWMGNQCLLIEDWEFSLPTNSRTVPLG